MKYVLILEFVTSNREILNIRFRTEVKNWDFYFNHCKTRIALNIYKIKILSNSSFTMIKIEIPIFYFSSESDMKNFSVRSPKV